MECTLSDAIDITRRIGELQKYARRLLKLYPDFDFYHERWGKGYPEFNIKMHGVDYSGKSGPYRVDPALDDEWDEHFDSHNIFWDICDIMIDDFLSGMPDSEFMVAGRAGGHLQWKSFIGLELDRDSIESALDAIHRAVDLSYEDYAEDEESFVDELISLEEDFARSSLLDTGFVKDLVKEYKCIQDVVNNRIADWNMICNEMRHSWEDERVDETVKRDEGGD